MNDSDVLTAPCRNGVSRTDIVAWKDVLLDGGMSNVTVRDVYLAAIKATMQYAVDQGHLAENPALGVKVRVRSAVQEREKGFDSKEAETILTATLRKPSNKLSVEMAAARRWIPWICAYSGARVNEITPLAGRDFIVRDGVPMVRVRAENNKTRKFREVPVHKGIINRFHTAMQTETGVKIPRPTPIQSVMEAV